MSRLVPAGLLATLAAGSFLVLASARPAAPGTAVRMDVPELVDHAELVLEARVRSTRTLRAIDGRWIETEYILDVDRTWVAQHVPVRTIRIPGGTLESGETLVIPGMPTIERGERVLLFLTGEGPTGIRMPVGLAQGKYRIVWTAHGKAAVPDSAPATLVDPALPEVRESQRVAAVEYAALIARIEAAAAAKSARALRAAAEEE